MPARRRPHAALVFSLILAAAGTVLVAALGGIDYSEAGEVGWVMLMAVAANAAAALWDRGSGQVETGAGFIPIVIAALDYGPGATLMVAIVSAAPFLMEGRRPMLRRMGTRVASGVIAAGLFASLPHASAHDFILSGFLCAFVYQVMQLALTSSIATLDGPLTLKQNMRSAAPHFGLGLLMFGPMAVAYAYVLPAAQEAVLIASFAVVASNQMIITVQRSRSTERMLSSMAAEIPGALLAALDASDAYTAQHSASVAAYSRDMASALGYEPRRARRVHAAALMHDLGKIGVPDAVLTKPGRLDESEWEMMRKHPELGANMVKRIPGFDALESAILSHHEREDGTGYPAGALGREIPEEAQIIAVADTYSAITTTRSYRAGREPSHAVSELKRDAESGKLNPQIVAVFLAILEVAGDDYRRGTHTTLEAEVRSVRGWLDLHGEKTTPQPGAEAS